MSDTTTTAVVTADDIKFLRWARKAGTYSITAAVHTELAKHRITPYGASTLTIHVTTRTYVGDQAVEGEAKRVIPIDFSRIESYEDLTGSMDWLSAVDMGAASYGSARTGLLLNLLDAGLRAGDSLDVSWCLANNSENLNNAGLSHDTCYVGIRRNGNRKGQFLVDDRIHKAGDTAGMAFRETGR